MHKIFICQKIFISLKTPKNIEIQKFRAKKITQAYVCMYENTPVPTLGPLQVAG